MRATTWTEIHALENVDEKGKKKHSIKLRHNPNAEWLTLEICQAYRTRALELGSVNDTGARRDLRIELQKKCDLTEVEALNILAGKHITEYVRKYDIMQGKDVAGYEMSYKDMCILDAMAEAEEKIKNEELKDENL